MWSRAPFGFSLSDSGRPGLHQSVSHTYDSKLEVIEVKPSSKRSKLDGKRPKKDTGGLYIPVAQQCKDWSTFQKLVVVVASAQALAEMKDADCRMFWRVLSAPKLQQLIVWNDVRAPKVTWDEGRFNAMFRGFVEAASQCPDSKLRRLHLPLFHSLPSERVYNYPPYVLARAQRLSQTSLTVQILSDQAPHEPGRGPLKAQYLALGSLNWNLSNMERLQLENVADHVKEVINNGDNQFLAFGLNSIVRGRTYTPYIPEWQLAKHPRVVLVHLHEFSHGYWTHHLQRIRNLTLGCHTLLLVLLAPLGYPIQQANDIRDFLVQNAEVRPQGFSSRVFVELNVKFANVMPSKPGARSEVLIAEHIVSMLYHIVDVPQRERLSMMLDLVSLLTCSFCERDQYLDHTP